MSHVTLNLVALDRCLQGRVPLRGAQAIVAALGAEPWTLGELSTALRRFMSAGDASRLLLLRDAAPEEPEPETEGRCLVDLTSRTIALEETTLRAGHRGRIPLDPLRAKSTRRRGRRRGHRTAPRPEGPIKVRFVLSDDWEFTDLDGWRNSREVRRQLFDPRVRPDPRRILFGEPLHHFLAERSLSIAAGGGVDESVLDREPLPADASPRAVQRRLQAALHAEWLLTPCERLCGASPRDALVRDCEFLAEDLECRAEQWMLTCKQPATLDENSLSYRLGGIGPNEAHVYYDLVRRLTRLALAEASAGLRSHSEIVERLTSEQARWLDEPDRDTKCVPRQIIETERRRLPLTSNGDVMIDCRCPICQMMADDPRPAFILLNTMRRDEDFAFSLVSRDAWEQQRRDERERARTAVSPVANPGDRGTMFSSQDGVWELSYVNENLLGPGVPVELQLMAVASRLGEIVTFLRLPDGADAAQFDRENLDDNDESLYDDADEAPPESPEELELVDRLNSLFLNYCEVRRHGPSSLVEPAMQRLTSELAEVARRRPDLERKCDLFEAELSRLGE